MLPSRRRAVWGALLVALACRWAAAAGLDDHPGPGSGSVSAVLTALTATLDGEPAPAPTFIDAEPGTDVTFGLKHRCALDANPSGPSGQGEWDLAATVWTVKQRRVDPDSQAAVWVDRPALTQTGASYRFAVPCGGAYAITAAAPTKGAAPAAVTSTVTVQHSCGADCGS